MNGNLLGRIFREDHAANAPASAGAYRRDIDGLRSVAILSVLAFHIWQGPLVSGGFIGVDIFFVISGYLISGILFTNLEKGRFSFLDFYARRVRRIFPAAILVLGTCLLAGWHYAPLGKHVAAGAGFVSNLVLWGEAGYFDTAAERKPLLHLWSLGIEEQFYIVLPIVMLLAWRFRLRFSLFFVVLFLASFWSGVHTLATDRTAAFYAPYNRGWELMAGCLLCLFTRRLAFDPASNAGPRLWVGLRNLLRFAEGPIAVGLVAWPVLDYSGRTAFPGWMALPPVLAACLLLHAGTRMREGQSWGESFRVGTLVNRLLLCNRPMVWIGLISYPLYLWHWPAWYFTKLVYPEPTAQVRIGVLAASFVLATLTYWLIERPVRFRHANRRAVVVCSVLMTALAIGGIWVWKGDGFTNQKDDLWNTYGRGAEPLPASWVRRADGLVQSAPGRPTVMLIGDSHAMALRSRLGELLQGRRDILLARDSGGGVPLAGVTWVSESPQNIFWQAHVKAQKEIEAMYRLLETPEGAQIHTVILVGYWVHWFVTPEPPFFLPEGTSSGDLAQHSLQMRRGYSQQALRQSLQRLAKHPVRVIFCLDIPRVHTPEEGKLQPAEYLPKPLLGAAHVPYLPRTYHDQDRTLYLSYFQPVLDAFPQVRVYDPSALICDQEKVWMIRDGKLLYMDDHHLSVVGGALVAVDLFQNCLQAPATAR